MKMLLKRRWPENPIHICIKKLGLLKSQGILERFKSFSMKIISMVSYLNKLVLKKETDLLMRNWRMNLRKESLGKIESLFTKKSIRKLIL